MSARPGGEAAIVGASTSGIGWETDRNAIELMADASLQALKDAGLEVIDVDGVFAVTPYHWMASVALADHLGIRPYTTDSTNIGGASAISLAGHALRAIALGQCEVALVAYGSTQRSDTGKLVTGAEPLSFEAPYGPQFPLSGYAMVTRRHMYEFGTTPEQLASVTVAASEWAALNPDALKRKPVSVADVLASPLVSDPLRRLDICLLTNGAGAVVLTHRERARGLHRQSVAVLGAGESHDHSYISSMRSFVATAARASSNAAYEMAGLGPRDMDFAQIYDAFTIMVPVGLEDLGFCPKGDGGPFVQHGIGPGSRLPVNTSGGGLRYCHPGMFGIFALIEGVRQLRGECGARQVHSARIGIVHGYGGIFAGNATMVLGRDG